MRKLWCYPCLALLLLVPALTGCGGGGGGGGSSNPVQVTFTEPVVKTVTAGASVTLAVQASTTSGSATISRVDFAANGTALGSVTSAPYQIIWNTAGLAAGTYQITATAYDDSNPAHSGSAQLTMTVKGASLSVSFTAPAAGARSVTQGASVTLSASASAAAGVGRVQFSDNGALIGTATTPSGGVYTVTWNTSAASVGIHTIGATVYDDAVPPNSTTTNIQITVTAPALPGPTVQINSPGADAVVSGTLSVTASAQAQAAGATLSKIVVTLGTLSATLNGTGAATLSGTVSLDTTVLSDGTYSLTAMATDSGGRQTSTTITVQVNNTNVPPPPPPF